MGELDLDRLPDHRKQVRALLSTTEAEELVRRGFEVRLLRVHEVRPLNPALVFDDATATRLLEDRLGGIEREAGR